MALVQHGPATLAECDDLLGKACAARAEAFADGDLRLYDVADRLIDELLEHRVHLSAVVP